ncbi:MAG: cyanophycin synthetase [Verrucomicrobiota bacterium]
MHRKDIRFLKILSLRGPNLWTYRAVLEAWVDIGELEDYPSHTIPGFVERLCRWLPSLSEHRCSYGEPGGFVKRLHEGTWPAHILEHVTLELQNLAGMPGGFGKARETGVRGVYKVVVRARQEDVTRACLEAARVLVMGAIQDTAVDLEAMHHGLRTLVGQHALWPNTACIVDAATDRQRGIPAMRLSADNLVQLGYGSRQRRIWAAETDRTGAIAEGIASTPELARELLKFCGLPVADHADKDSGYHGRAHRLLVVGNRLVAAACLQGECDGEEISADVTDRVHAATAAAACLAARVVGLDIAGVDLVAVDISLPLGAQHGAITAVHAGPCLITHLHPSEGQARPVGQAIVDHLFPDGDAGRIPVVGITGSSGMTEVAQWIAEFLRLGGKFTGLACGDGLFLDRRRIQTLDSGNWQSGTHVLMNRLVEAAVLENGARVILGEGLAYDRCQVGVVTRIDPAAHFGAFHIERAEQVYQVFRTQVDVVLPDGVAVLHAADPLVAEMAPLCDGEVIFFAVDGHQPVLSEHCARGGRGVFVRDGRVILAKGAEETLLVPLSVIPDTTDIALPDHLENVLAAVGAAWALGIALHVIRTGLETFSHEASVSAESGHVPSHARSSHSPTA